MPRRGDVAAESANSKPKSPYLPWSLLRYFEGECNATEGKILYNLSRHEAGHVQESKTEVKQIFRKRNKDPGTRNVESDSPEPRCGLYVMRLASYLVHGVKPISADGLVKAKTCLRETRDLERLAAEAEERMWAAYEAPTARPMLAPDFPIRPWLASGKRPGVDAASVSRDQARRQHSRPGRGSTFQWRLLGNSRVIIQLWTAIPPRSYTPTPQRWLSNAINSPALYTRPPLLKTPRFGLENARGSPRPLALSVRLSLQSPEQKKRALSAGIKFAPCSISPPCRFFPVVSTRFRSRPSSCAQARAPVPRACHVEPGLLALLARRLRVLVLDEGDNHAVEVEEEHDEVEAELDEGFLAGTSVFAHTRDLSELLGGFRRPRVPSCARSVSGRSPSRPAGAGCRRSSSRSTRAEAGSAQSRSSTR